MLEHYVLWALLSVVGVGNTHNPHPSDPLHEVMEWCLRMHWIELVSRDVIHDQNRLYRLQTREAQEGAQEVEQQALVVVAAVRSQVYPEVGGR